MGAVEADELIIGRVIVGRADDMSPPGLKSPFLTDFDKSCFLSYLGVAVVYSPFIPSGLPGNNRFRGIKTPVEVRIVKNFTWAEFLRFNEACEYLIYICGRITLFLFGFSQELIHGHQNIMGRFPVPLVSGLQCLLSLIPITVIEDELVKIGKFAEILCVFPDFCSQFIPVVQRPSAQILDATLVAESCGFNVEPTENPPPSSSRR